VVAYALDITERKRAEAALRSTVRRLSRLFATNLLGVLYFDIEGGVQDANDEFLRIIGYERADLTNGIITKPVDPPLLHALFRAARPKQL
jgi:PAS domain S-box-containing protein